jgi:hypothetical protein
MKDFLKLFSVVAKDRAIWYFDCSHRVLVVFFIATYYYTIIYTRKKR